MRPDYEALRDSNPYKVLREEAQLSQKQLGFQVNMTSQYIYRHENGLVNTPSYALAQALLGAGATVQQVKNVTEEYFAWVHEMRRFIIPALSKRDPLVGPYAVVLGIKDQHPIYPFMWNINAQVAEYVEYDQDWRSEQLFNRFLCLHPRNVQNTRTEKALGSTGVLGETLVEVGLGSYLHRLDKEIEVYRGRTK